MDVVTSLVGDLNPPDTEPRRRPSRRDSAVAENPRQLGPLPETDSLAAPPPQPGTSRAGVFLSAFSLLHWRSGAPLCSPEGTSLTDFYRAVVQGPAGSEEKGHCNHINIGRGRNAITCTTSICGILYLENIEERCELIMHCGAHVLKTWDLI
jgi:hypothetical protein